MYEVCICCHNNTYPKDNSRWADALVCLAKPAGSARHTDVKLTRFVSVEVRDGRLVGSIENSEGVHLCAE